MKLARAIAVVAACAAAACSGAQQPPENRVSGYVEATEVQVAPDVGGRILELRVREGDRASQGDVLAVLDRRDTELQIQRLRAERLAADAHWRLLRAGSRDEDIRHAEAQVAAAAADASAAEADRQSAELDFERFETLLAANAGSRKQRDDAYARVQVAQQRERAATARVASARETLDRLRSGARPQELDAARARVDAADAQVALLQKGLSDAELRSPAAGVVTQTLVEQGEIAGVRNPVLVITDLDRAWANLFVPEPLMPRLKLGQSAVVLTDAGDRLPGKVTFVSPRAEFTPRNVQTADERSRLVYRIKVSVDNRGGVLKQGMPVDAELELR